MAEKNLYRDSLIKACGEMPDIDPQDTLFADDAVERLPSILEKYSDGKSVAVLMDRRTKEAAGNEVCAALCSAGWQVMAVVVPDPEPGKSPVCDDITKERLQPAISGASIVLTVGSGVVNDLGKWTSCDAGLPYVSFATAASMNGYSSANVAPAVKGVKTLVRGAAPKAVVSSPQIIASAPYEMTASGLGDILAKSVSSADWKMNSILFGDEYIPAVVDLIVDIEPLYLENPEGIRSGDPAAIHALYDGLLLTGVAMTLAGTSSPASGGEHMISHTLDMMSSIDGQPHDLHGRQVGVGTVIASEVYRRIIKTESPEFVAPQRAIDNRFWGKLAGVVSDHYEGKNERLEAAGKILSEKSAWDNLRAEVSQLTRSPVKIKDCLKRAGAANTAEDLGMSRERLLAAFTHAHEIRSRFTILDLAWLTGILPGKCGEIIEEFA
ncbi:MAG: iron-containing alcohol dehydrogenase [Planctomycetes bacterium]|nr:iron-containing alcohol dehydrogenase [Planctomycetota bacterium]